MTPLTLAMSLMEASYKYATTDIALPNEVADFLLDWNQLNIPEDVLHADEDGGKGREMEPHITVKYGLLAKDCPEELKEIAQNTPPFPIFMGSISLFTTNPEFDVVKIGVESPWLRKLNQQISAAIPHEDTYKDYNPHITLAYVEKGTCNHMVDDDPFASKEIPNEFTASGFRFAGSGDSEDPQRAEDMLLFSRTKKLDMALAEQALPSVARHDDHFTQQRQEIATATSNLVDSWRRQGLTTDQMMRRLKTGNWGSGQKYWHNRQGFPRTFKRFVDQATEYIEQLREAKFAETVIDVDPFASCGFPVDPDRTKLFLRSNGKRRDQRVIL